jgi:hypothetical protein
MEPIMTLRTRDPNGVEKEKRVDKRGIYEKADYEAA